MAIFLMYGTYTSEALKGISGERTEKAGSIIKDLGGSVKCMYATLGDSDLLLVVDLPGIREAMRASVALNKMSGIAFSTCPAVAVEDFDKMMD